MLGKETNVIEGYSLIALTATKKVFLYFVACYLIARCVVSFKFHKF